MNSEKQLISLVVPVRNEEEVLPTTYESLNPILEELKMPFEVIVVDNGCTDATPVIGQAICGRDPRWKYLRLSRDFGYQNSITAGMLAARGVVILILDAHLQEPPVLIKEV